MNPSQLIAVVQTLWRRVVQLAAGAGPGITPMRVAAGQVHCAGMVAGQVHSTGLVAGQVHCAGIVVGQVVCSGAVTGEVV